MLRPYKMPILPVPFFPSPVQLTGLIANNIGFYLDSADLGHAASRYSYVGIQPDSIVRGASPEWKGLPEPGKREAGPFPFMGGWVGFAGYECGSAHILGYPVVNDVTPGFWFGHFDRVLVLDHERKEAHLCFEDDEGGMIEALGKISRDEAVDEGVSSWIESPDFGHYAEVVTKIKNYLEAGDAYQVNYTRRFVATTTIDVAESYLRLRQASPGPYSAFINTGDAQVFSLSPELLLSCNGREIITRPIKGTTKKHDDAAEDAVARDELSHSAKAGAELLMITDLERNDFGRVCEFGSVTVDALQTVESYAAVHHLVSTIRGTLKDGVTIGQAFDAIFPGGSITGAPKKRAMQIIAELEEGPRNVYTGAVGYISDSGNALFNIPIRTVLKYGDRLHLHAGGGIVVDSDAWSEYEEMWMKIASICGALGLAIPVFK